MVYRGKPSTACERCKKRRIRCDRREGGCSQCWRIGKECSGYSAEFETIPLHLVQTTTTMRKHGGRAKSLDPLRVIGVEAQHNTPAQTPLPALAQSLDDLALAYCYQFHVIRPGPANVVHDKKVLTSMKALGMLSYSNVTHSTELQEEASNYYLSALRMVNAALQSPATARQDSTLLAVIALSCFESLTGGSLKRSMEAWSVHIQGLSALIAQRGVLQFQTIAGRIFFFQACAFIVGDCIRAGLSVPEPVRRLIAMVADKDVRWRPLSTLFEAADFKASVLSGELTVLEEIIAKARSLDREFATAYSPTTPEGFEYETIAHRTRVGSQLPAYVYSFKTAVAATMWNTMRCGRLLCNGIMVDTWKRQAFRNPEADFSIELEESQNTILRLQMDMLASISEDTRTTGVPRWEAAALISGEPLGMCSYYSDAAQPQSGEMTPPDLPTLDFGRGYAQMFNLVLAGRLASAGSEIRVAICRIFNLIERVRGLRVASVLKAALEEHHESSIFVYYQRKGDYFTVKDSWESDFTTNSRLKLR